MRQYRSRVARLAVVAVAAFAMAVPAFAQTPAAQAPPAGPVKRLSMEDAISLALQNNLSLRVERINPELQDLAIAQARTVWTPNLTGSVSTSSRTSPISGFFSGATDKLTRDNLGTAVGANQVVPWGANYSVSWDTARNESNSVYDSPNPSLASNLSFSFTQPLLRNLKTDSARTQLVVSKMNREISDIDLRQTVLTTVRSVKYAYWDVRAAVAALQVARQSLDLAREALRNNRSKVEIGTMAPIDIVEAEAEEARRTEAVIVAEAAVKRSEDRLRTIILDTKDADYWATRFDLTEQPTFEAMAVDVEAAVRTALEKRTDLRLSRKNLEITGTNIRYQRNQTLPDLNAQVGYGLSGQGGRKLNFGPGFPPPVIGEIEEGFGTMMNRLLGNDYHNWSFAVQFSYPIGNGSAEAQLARTKLQLSQAEISAAEPRTAGGHVGARRGAQRRNQSTPPRVHPGHAQADGAPHGGRAEEVRGRAIDELPGVPGAARPGRRPVLGTGRTARLQQVAGRSRDRSGGADCRDDRRVGGDGAVAEEEARSQKPASSQ